MQWDSSDTFLCLRVRHKEQALQIPYSPLSHSQYPQHVEANHVYLAFLSYQQEDRAHSMSEGNCDRPIYILTNQIPIVTFVVKLP